MRITKLEYQKKDKERVNVFVDEKFVCGVGVNDVIGLGLHVGKEIDGEFLNKIIAESEFGKVLNFALNYLSYRPRSEFEVRFHLKRKTSDKQIIDTVIEKLKQKGFLNDENFTKWFVEQRNNFRPKGTQAINAELRRKGIKTPVKLDNEFELAMRIANKGNTDRQKLTRKLAARGFGWETIRMVVDKVFGKEYNDI